MVNTHTHTKALLSFRNLSKVSKEAKAPAGAGGFMSSRGSRAGGPKCGAVDSWGNFKRQGLVKGPQVTAGTALGWINTVLWDSAFQ